MLRFPEQVPLGSVNRVIRLLQHLDGGLRGGRHLPGGLCLLLPSSPSPPICRPQAKETDKWEDILEEPPTPGSEQLAPGNLGFLHSPSQTRDSSPQPSMGGGPEIQLQREPADGALCWPCRQEHALAETGLEIFELQQATLTSGACLANNEPILQTPTAWGGGAGEVSSMLPALQGSGNVIYFKRR